MNLGLLEHFLAAYETKSIGKAAVQLGLSQPALSKSIRKLETELDVPLFHRTTKGITPTPYADTLARRGQAIQADVHNSIVELQKLKRGEVGEARIGIAPALAPHFMPDVVARIAASHPSINLTVIEAMYEGVSQAVVRGELDFALTNLAPRGVDPDLTWRALFQDCFVVCCAKTHPLARKRKVQPAELLKYPWITPAREGLPWQRLADCFLAARCAPPRAMVETNSASVIMSLLQRGPFLTFVPRQIIQRDRRQAEAVEVNLEGMSMERAIVVLHRKGHGPTKAAQIVLDACEAVVLESGLYPEANES
ncbi:LysR family transcriptional regulator [Ottowia caeni]|uniref:LysR family transcriptional regulator n=1 Tax=Ottowia caeni TaxID=2870339 RepID=UPI001E50F39A|nr:LysR family transcriptional regulator [Ottowia caeni]